MTTDTKTAGRPLTGRMVLAITLSAFTVIIGANMALLYAAIGSFPGLVVANSYVASQTFDADRARQEGLGWRAVAAYAPGQLTLRLTEADGAAAVPAQIRAVVGRATHVKDDRILDFKMNRSGELVAPATLAGGHWRVYLDLAAADGTAFHQTLALFVTGAQAADAGQPRP